MKVFHGENAGALIILHGGAGPQDPSNKRIAEAEAALLKSAKQAARRLNKGRPLIEVATYCLRMLEDDSQFNAGIGSALQSDGMARVSASIMDGKRQRFSGVISAAYIAHPSQLAAQLQKREARVITQPGTELLARKLALPIEANLSEKRAKLWLKKSKAKRFRIDAVDTVGCVIRTKDGKLIAGSSTGGRGFEFPGRVSDTATVAGNYASPYAAIAATGIGEEIVDDAVAARIETCVRDGLDLHAACQKGFKEAKKRKRQYGWIALDSDALWSVGHTTPSMPFVVLHQGRRLRSSREG